MKTFEEFLNDKCPCHTNNSPEGFEKWEEQLDIQELEDFAQEYGELKYNEGIKSTTIANKYNDALEIDEIVELIKNQGNINC